ncbi:putative adipose-regulatory protein-domain-containing protein [Irpex rosettiformis]|uniref:Adipose-regulatory protein-domain-containing protein n=1 Tax=Irpex rosettiformis TaxID=378272 RepID=A0ACB8UKY3_9APHY|nr:putative adipose-regulatory protein-domain-containing protein [Irpex rosettiformis]
MNAEDKKHIDNGSSLLSTLLWFPAQLVLDLVDKAWRSFRPYFPQVVPLIVFLISIPVLFATSISAGWFVWRKIAVGWETDLYLQYGDGISPYAQTELSLLARQQQYHISLQLTIPTSSSNFELGNFMTTLTLYTPRNQTIASVRRPALALPSNKAPWSFLFGARNTITIDVPLFSNILFESTAAIAFVEVGRSDHWRSLGRGEGRELTVSSAILRGVVVHKGLRGIITRFPLLTALSASGAFFFISFVALASCLLPMIEWRLQGYTEAIETTPNTSGHDKSLIQKSRRVKREASVPATPRAPRSKRSRSLGSPRSVVSQPSIKAEEIVTSIPSSSSTSQESPLRRRRSRLSEHENE